MLPNCGPIVNRFRVRKANNNSRVSCVEEKSCRSTTPRKKRLLAVAGVLILALVGGVARENSLLNT